MDEEKVILNDALIKSMSIGKIFKDFKAKVNSLDFSDDGTLLVCADETTLIIYDALNAKKTKTLFNKVNGIRNVRFTHSNEAVLCSSKESPYQIFYWSIHENEIIKVFEGHDEDLTTLCLNPSDDSFVSIGGRSQLRVFDLGADNSQPLVELDLREDGSQIAANFDNKGIVLAVSVYKEEAQKKMQRIDLYDVKRYGDGRFESFRIDAVEQIQSLVFSSNGASILASTTGEKIYLIDAFEGKLKKEFIGHSHDLKLELESGFSPDSRYVISGSEDGNILIWDSESKSVPTELIVSLEGHIKPSRCAKFNPHFVMMASAGQNVILWIPKFMG